MEARRETVLRAKGLRRRMTFPEVLLWRELRKAGHGYKFRRQHPVGPYVLDFYCEAARLAVEVDGADHNDEAATAYDERRDAWLKRQGIRVLRLSARLVFQDMDTALLTILGEAQGG
jgi:very-short-patch-repair endonuclease